MKIKLLCLFVFLLFFLTPAFCESANYTTNLFTFSLQGSAMKGATYEANTYSSFQPMGNAQSPSYQAIVGSFSKTEAIPPIVTFNILISSTKTVTAGQVYSANIEIKDSSGNYTNASSLPKITLYDPLRNIIASNASAIFVSTGVYQYNFTTSSLQIAGQWQTVVSITINGVSEEYNDYWKLTGSPAEVSIISISGTAYPIITADVIIANEGNAGYEYDYEYCIVPKESYQCGGFDDIDYGAGSKVILRGQSWNTRLTLNVEQPGTYWFKVIVYYNSQASGATKSFTAVIQTPAPQVIIVSGGGGGGGSVSTVNVFPVSKKQFVVGTAYQLSSNDKLTINFIPSGAQYSQAHSVLISAVGANTVTLIIQSNPMTVQLGVGEEKNVDIDNDGIYDLYVRLERIIDGKAEIIVKQADELAAIRQSPITGQIITRPETIMDIFVNVLGDYKVNTGQKVLAEITFFNFGTEDIIDAAFSYCVKDSNGNLVVGWVKDTVAVHTKTQFIKEIVLPKNLEDGVYYINTRVQYNSETAESNDNFEIAKEKAAAVSEFNLYALFLIGGIIALIVFFLAVFVLYLRPMTHVPHRTFEGAEYFRNQKRAGPGDKQINLQKTLQKKEESIKTFFNLSVKPKFDFLIKPKRPNRLSSVIGMRVYSSNGKEVGKIKDVFLENNKIYGWLVYLNKKTAKNSDKKLVLVKQNYKLISIKDAVIIDEKILEDIKNLIQARLNNQIPMSKQIPNKIHNKPLYSYNATG